MALNVPVSPIVSGSLVQPTRSHLPPIAGTIDDDDSTEPDRCKEVEDELSEQQLRELYDSEEIDRFLNLFSAVGPCCCRPSHATS
jgi:GRAM domain-containing protein 4